MYSRGVVKPSALMVAKARDLAAYRSREKARAWAQRKAEKEKEERKMAEYEEIFDAYDAQYSLVNFALRKTDSQRKNQQKKAWEYEKKKRAEVAEFLKNFEERELQERKKENDKILFQLEEPKAFLQAYSC
ncbi:hypothetical protein OTU49_009363 [Cherax quadricarinatus]|uniref:Uncharacterized protein n=1 Tax=Cherax quadricarinatus TaxID=27406 RepID=A0AAW0WLA7_CHEQU